MSAIKYKRIKVLPKVGKMRVSPSQSEALQTELFDKGYKWASVKELQPAVKNTDKPFLYFDEDSEILYSEFFEENYFIKSEEPLLLFNDYFEEDND